MDLSFKKVDSMPKTLRRQGRNPSVFEEPVRESMETGEIIATEVAVDDLAKAKQRLRAVGTKLNTGLTVSHELNEDNETATLYFQARDKRNNETTLQKKLKATKK